MSDTLESPRLDTSVLTDLAANIFALLLAMMLIILATDQAARSSRAPRQNIPVEAETDLRILERAPLTPAETIKGLQAGSPGTTGLAIELYQNRIRLITEGQTDILPMHEGDDGRASKRLADMLDERRDTDAVQVYVFANDHYNRLFDVLSREAESWREISVPAALRDYEMGQDWSPAFERLAAARLDEDAFRAGLARLLSATTARRDNSGFTGQDGASSYRTALPIAALERLRHLFAWLLVLVAPAVALATIVVVERTCLPVPLVTAGRQTPC